MSVQGEAWDAQLQPLLDRDAPPATTPTVVPQRTQAKMRLQSLDVMRGFTM